MRRLLTILTLFLCATPALAGSIAPPASIPGTPGLSAALNARKQWRPIGNNINTANFATSNAGDIGCTARRLYTTVGPVSAIRIHTYDYTANETAGASPIIYRAAIEYPLGSYSTQMTVAGVTTWVTDPNSAGTWTDACPVPNIPANTQFAVRLYARKSVAPASPSATIASTAVLPGNLSTSTTYYYKITSVDNGVESIGSTEVSAAPSVGNAAITLAWTANAFASAYKIYRGTSTGTEVYLTTVLAPQVTWEDVGAVPAGTASVPTTAAYYYGSILLTGESANTVYAGGNGSDQTAATGAITGASGGGSGAAFAVTPDCVIGDDSQTTSIVLLGDSIGAGSTGIIAPAALNNWFNKSMTPGITNSLNCSIGGERIKAFASYISGHPVKNRMALISPPDVGSNNYFVIQLGRNDLFTDSRTWQQVGGDVLTVAQQLSYKGNRPIVLTLLPGSNSTDGWITVGNQSASSATPHANYNQWVRGGCPVLPGALTTPVAVGTTNAIPCPYIYQTIDLCSALETSQDSDIWKVPVAASLTSQTATGSPTTTTVTISGAAYTASQYINYMLRCDSGTANNVGKARLISANTATAFTVAAFPSSMASGDTFSVWPVYTVDGTHPSDTGDAYIAANLWTTSLVATFAPFVTP